jgi:hypothetical protein
VAAGKGKNAAGCGGCGFREDYSMIFRVLCSFFVAPGVGFSTIAARPMTETARYSLKAPCLTQNDRVIRTIARLFAAQHLSGVKIPCTFHAAKWWRDGNSLPSPQPIAELIYSTRRARHRRDPATRGQRRTPVPVLEPARLYHCRRERVPRQGVRFDRKLYSRDSTMVDLCLKVFDWAELRS